MGNFPVLTSPWRWHWWNCMSCVWSLTPADVCMLVLCPFVAALGQVVSISFKFTVHFQISSLSVWARGHLSQLEMLFMITRTTGNDSLQLSLRLLLSLVQLWTCHYDCWQLVTTTAAVTNDMVDNLSLWLLSTCHYYCCQLVTTTVVTCHYDCRCHYKMWLSLPLQTSH